MLYATFGAGLVPTSLFCLTLQHTLFIMTLLCVTLHFNAVPFNGRGAALITFAQHGDAHRSWVFHSVTASCLLIVPAMLVWEENVLIKSSFLLFQETYHMNIK